MTRAAVLAARLPSRSPAATGGLAEERRGDLVYATGGEGPGRVTVIRRADARGPLPLVLFLHGWGATEPRFYRGWVEHLARAGNAVIYPRYQDSVAEPPTQVLGNALVGVRIALGELDAEPDSLVVAGHSAGGGLAADYAAIARRTGAAGAARRLQRLPGPGVPRGPVRHPAGLGPCPTASRRAPHRCPRPRDLPADARAIYAGAQTRDRWLGRSGRRRGRPPSARSGRDRAGGLPCGRCGRGSREADPRSYERRSPTYCGAAMPTTTPQPDVPRAGSRRR